MTMCMHKGAHRGTGRTLKSNGAHKGAHKGVRFRCAQGCPAGVRKGAHNGLHKAVGVKDIFAKLNIYTYKRGRVSGSGGGLPPPSFGVTPWGLPKRVQKRTKNCASFWRRFGCLLGPFWGALWEGFGSQNGVKSIQVRFEMVFESSFYAKT